PLVAPHVTRRPRLPNASSDRAHVAWPTVSTTTSAPRLPVLARTSRATSWVRWLNAASAPNPSARSSFVSLPDVTHTRAPCSFAICSAARATPPPIPQINTRSPSRTAARVTIIRQAVSMANGSAAATSHGTVDATRRTLGAGTTMYSAHVPGMCSPRILYATHNDCSPSPQYS